MRANVPVIAPGNPSSNGEPVGTATPLVVTVADAVSGVVAPVGVMYPGSAIVTV